MVTRLSQTRVKGGDPQYPTLKEEMRARVVGGDYKIPAGGIPRSDLSDDVQNTLKIIETAYQKPDTGIPNGDLDINVRALLKKAGTSYQKPDTGIPLADLQEDLQKRLTDFTNFYVYPKGGIPMVDLDTNVKDAINTGKKAYQKPADGIPVSDLVPAVEESMKKADTAYQKPSTGIPLHDLADEVVQPEALKPFGEHIKDTSIHITDHNHLQNIGKLSHEEIERSLESIQSIMALTQKELEDARDEFGSVGDRIDASIGRNTTYEIKTYKDWALGTFDGLRLNGEGNVSFAFDPEQLVMTLHDIKTTDMMTEQNKVGILTFGNETYIPPTSDQWIPSIAMDKNVGIRLNAFIYAPVTGNYTFSTQFTGRIRMKVAGQLIIDNSSSFDNSNFLSIDSKAVPLEAGRLYPISVEAWSKSTSNKGLGLYWKPPGKENAAYLPMNEMNMSGYTRIEGTYTSQAIDLGNTEINMWYLDIDMIDFLQDDDDIIELAFSDDGVIFSNWYRINVGEIPMTPKRYIKVRHTLKKLSGQYTPLLRGYSIRYISAENNEMRKEIIQARGTFDTLQQRIDKIDTMMMQVQQLYEDIKLTGIHPEQFASVRLLEIELNMLQYYMREAKRIKDLIELTDGRVDPLANENGIDKEKSSKYTWSTNGIQQMQSQTVFNKNEDWAKWNLDHLDYRNDMIELLYAFDTGQMSNPRSTAQRIGNWGSSQYDGLAQPFYTIGNKITSIQLYAQSYESGQDTDVMIVGIRSDGFPDFSKVLWSQQLNGSESGTLNFSPNIAVERFTKYWLIVRDGRRYENLKCSQDWDVTDSTNAHIRLRSENPVGKSLTAYQIRGYGQGSVTEGWSTGRMLRFNMTETGTLTQETEGRGSIVIDYKQPTQFVKAVNQTILNNGFVDFSYQTSFDNTSWSQKEANLPDVPVGRYLKVNATIRRKDMTSDTPRIKEVKIFYRDDTVGIVSRQIMTKNIPTHVIVTGSADNPDAVRFSVSRDDGETWADVDLNAYTELSSIRPGNMIRLKAHLDSRYPDTLLKEWGIIAFQYRDVTGQNITALHEEFIAEDGQKTFYLEGSYPMGNHSLQVYVNGIRQSLGRDYKEINNHIVEFNEGLYNNPAGVDVVTFVVATGAYDVHDMTLVTRVDDIERMHQEELVDYEKIHTYNEKDQLIKTKYEGTLDYYTIEYSYYDDGRKHLEVTTKGSKIKTKEYIYDDKNRLEKERVTMSEVTI